MKLALDVLLLVSLFSVGLAKLHCDHPKPEIPTEWIDMGSKCIPQMKKQIVRELNASMTYLSMGAYFSKDTVNLPGFAKLFFESASEERSHAIKLISYLLMRGELTSSVNNLIPEIAPYGTSWTDGMHALKEALKLEAKVTNAIRELIIVCESDLDRNNKHYNDYHLVDYLTSDFLEEQYHGQRDIAGKISTLAKFSSANGVLGQFLFDKKLLSGEA